MNKFTGSLECSESQIQKLSNLVAESPKIFSSNDLMKLNRSISYTTFTLKEIYDYFTAKHDGISINNLRILKNDIDKIKNLLSKF